MKKNLKKVLASTLALLMILAMLPTFAFAEGTPGIFAAEDENSGIAAAEPMEAYDETVDGFLPDLGGIGDITSPIGYSKYVYVVPAEWIEGVEAWVRIDVVNEAEDGTRTKLASGAIPMGFGMWNTVSFVLTPSAAKDYHIKTIEGTNTTHLKIKSQGTNYAVATIGVGLANMDTVVTVVLGGGGSSGGNPDIPEIKDKVSLVYTSAIPCVVPAPVIVDSNEEGTADIVLAAAPVLEGYIFKGWKIDGVVYQPGDTVTLSGVNYAEAVWEAKGEPTPPVVEGFTLTFDPNGGQNGPAAQSHEKDSLVSLDLASPKPTHEMMNEHTVLFIGWTMVQHDVLTKADEPVFADHVIKMDSDKTAYALWGLDENENKIPDVYEKLKYELHYDANGGNGNGMPEPVYNILFGTEYPLDYTCDPQHDDVEGKKVVFIGWTDRLNKADHIYAKNEDVQITTLRSVEIIANTTVYAAWGFDENNDGKPDVLQKFVDLTYDPATGTGGPGVEEVVTKSTVTLKMEPKPVHTPAMLDGVSTPIVFAGWDTIREDYFYKRGEVLHRPLITELAIPAESEGEVVYAVYGYDDNNNGIADVLEDEVKLTYDANGGKGGPSEVMVQIQKGYVLDAVNVPTHTDIIIDKVFTSKVLFAGWSTSRHILPLSYKDEAPADMVKAIDIEDDTTVYAVWALDQNENDVPDYLEDKFILHFDILDGIEGSGPADMKLVDGFSVNLKTVLPQPKHEAVDEVAVVFVGWTENPADGILTKNDKAALDVVLDKVTIEGADKTVYALYGEDRNGNGIADVLEDMVFLTYDPNGGEGGPGVVEVAKTKFYKLDRKNVPAHADVDDSKIAFIGWSLESTDKIFDVGEKDEYKVEKFIDIEGDTTVYAVWGYDHDGNGNADVEEYEEVYTLTYDANGGKDAPAAQKAYSKDGKGADLYISKDVPTNGSKTFRGWATTPTGGVSFRPGQKVTLTTDVTLYAVWGNGGGGFPDGGFPGGGTPGKGGNPKTGDESSLALWAGIAALSVIGMGAVLTIGRKHGKKN